MIYDRIENAGKYRGLSKWLDIALDFMEKTDLNSLPAGRTEICGDQVFVNVMEAQAKPESEGKFEIHEKYMDIQIDLEGTEIIQVGLEVEGIETEFNPETDFGTVICREAASCRMGPGRFIVCMGKEPHKPGIQAQENPVLKKCVIKVSVA